MATTWARSPRRSSRRPVRTRSSDPSLPVGDRDLKAERRGREGWRHLERLWSETSERPLFGWENYEDLIYHDTYYHEPRLDESPDVGGFLHRVWVFNRAMEWHHIDGCLVCYSAGGNLPLTGVSAVSAWHTGSAN